MGTNLGAGQTARAVRSAWTAAALGAAFTAGIGVLGFVWPGAWIGFFTTSAAVNATAASYLCIASLAFPFIGLGLPLSSAFQAAARPLWPLLSFTSRAIVVAAGGWIVAHATDTGLRGLAVVAALGMVVYGVTLVAAFRGRAWRAAIRPTGSGRLAVAAGCGLLLVGASAPVRAAEVQLLSAAALQSVFNEVACELERTSGHRLVNQYGTIGGSTSRSARRGLRTSSSG